VHRDRVTAEQLLEAGEFGLERREPDLERLRVQLLERELRLERFVLLLELRVDDGDDRRRRRLQCYRRCGSGGFEFGNSSLEQLLLLLLLVARDLRCNCYRTPCQSGLY
jgi:hypothetical protein